jgi:hypothetical protein
MQLKTSNPYSEGSHSCCFQTKSDKIYSWVPYFLENSIRVKVQWQRTGAFLTVPSKQASLPLITGYQTPSKIIRKAAETL